MDYHTVKSAILQRFGLDTKVYRRRWWTISRKEGETMVQYCHRVSDLTNKYVEGCDTIAEVGQAFTIENVLAMLANNIAFWTRDKNPTLHQVGVLAGEYLRDRNLSLSAGDQQKKWTPESNRFGPTTHERPKMVADREVKSDPPRFSSKPGAEGPASPQASNQKRNISKVLQSDKRPYVLSLP